MVELQLVNRVLKNKSTSILTLNSIGPEYFTEYLEEYTFIIEHEREYGTVPDKETFVAKFPDFPLIEVSEPDKYLIDTINEEHLYNQTVPVVQKMAELLNTDSQAAVEYLLSSLPSLQVRSAIMGTDIISQARKRYEEWRAMKEDRDQFVMGTGFDQLDDVVGGWHRGEELGVIFGRTGKGKSWVLIKSLQHAHRLGFRAGLIEPEMSDSKTGYRFDTLQGHLSNAALVRGEDADGYEEYISKLEQEKTPFFVVHPKEFHRKITVSKLRSFCLTNNIDILGIDGISYMTDERAVRGDNRSTQLTNISEDLMDLSIELGIPILVVCQANRGGATENNPGLENIRDSDGIAFNASVVISINQKDDHTDLYIEKNRNGITGSKLMYMWDIDKGIFTYIENDEEEHTSRQQNPDDDPPWNSSTAPEYKDATEVF